MCGLKNHKPSIWEWDEWLRAPIKKDIYGALRGWFTVVKKPHGYGKDARHTPLSVADRFPG